jgi:hypothetical protein
MLAGRPILIAFVALGAACGSSPALRGGGPDGGDAATVDVGATAATWVDDLTAVYCAWAVRCGRFSGPSGCKAYMGPQFAVVNFNAPFAAALAVAKGTAQFDQRQAGDCLTGLANLDCDQDLQLGVAPPRSCAGVFSGNVADGGTCIDDVECAEGSTCVISSTENCDGRCAPMRAGDCRTKDDCPADQYCAGASLQGAGLSTPGRCEMLVPPGAAPGDVCGRPVQCGDGLVCAGGPAPARCTTITTAKMGEACGGYPFFSPSCADGLACVPSDDGKTSTCLPAAKLGDPCTAVLQCGRQYGLRDLVCDVAGTHTCVHRSSTGTCQIIGREDTCDPATSHCDAASGTCQPTLAVGAPCVFPAGGIDPCGLWASCSGPGPVCAPLLGACRPR